MVGSFPFSSSCLSFPRDNQISTLLQQDVLQAEALQSMYSVASIHFKIIDFKVKV